MQFADLEIIQPILKALKERPEQQTTIIIAHRLSSVMHADKILMLQHGRILQEGTHSELSSEAGIYRQLCEIQGAIQQQIEEDIHAANTDATTTLDTRSDTRLATRAEHELDHE